MKKVTFIAAALVLGLSNSVHAADCFDNAARVHAVNPWVLRAIAYQESKFRPSTINHNTNKSTDTGMMGTNSVHLDELERFGISKNDLVDGCKSIFVGAWYLRKKMAKHGNTCKAIGAYHSETAALREAYIVKIREALALWNISLNC